MARPEAHASSTQLDDSPESDDPSLPAPGSPFEGVPLVELRASSSAALASAIDRLLADIDSDEEVTAGFNSAV